MAEALEKLNNLLLEETFVRKQINHSEKYFTDIDSILDEIKSKEDIANAIDIAKGQVSKNANHISALYSLAILNFKSDNFTDLSMERVLYHFKNSKKWALVEFISNKVLSYYESDYALRYLASYYQAMNKENESISVWERLIKFDTQNPEIAERVAHLKEEAGDINSAVVYYKVAFERNLLRQRNNAQADIQKILSLNPDNYNYLIKHENTLAELLDADMMIDIWKIIFFFYFEKKDYNNSLKVIKHLLNYEQKIVKQNNKKAKFFRHRLTDVYRGLYPNHSLFEKVEELSSLTNVFKPPKECIEIFERYIQYDVGRYVMHRTLGVGIIKAININDVTISFKSQEEYKKMTFDMAIKSLTTIQDDDLNVYKTYKLEELKKMAMDNISTFLSIILKYRGSISTKDLKQEIVPSIIPEAQYTKWLESAKKEIRATNTLRFDKNTFLYNSDSLSYDDESIEKFKKAKTFLEAYQIYTEYISYTKNSSSAEANEMYNYFVEVAKDSKADSLARVISIIFLSISSKKESGIPKLENVVKDINASDFSKIYDAAPLANYREILLDAIKKGREDDAYDIIRKMLYSQVVKNAYIIVNRLVAEKKIKLLEETIDDIFFHYKEYPEVFLYFAQKILDGEYKKDFSLELNVNYQALMIGLLSLITYLSKLSDKKESAANARKMLKVVYELTFDKKHLLNFIENGKEEDVKKIYAEFEKLITLEQNYKTDIISAVTKRFNF